MFEEFKSPRKRRKKFWSTCTKNCFGANHPYLIAHECVTKMIIQAAHECSTTDNQHWPEKLQIIQGEIRSSSTPQKKTKKIRSQPPNTKKGAKWWCFLTELLPHLEIHEPPNPQPTPQAIFVGNCIRGFVIGKARLEPGVSKRREFTVSKNQRWRFLRKPTTQLNLWKSLGFPPFFSPVGNSEFHHY